MADIPAVQSAKTSCLDGDSLWIVKGSWFASSTERAFPFETAMLVLHGDIAALQFPAGQIETNNLESLFSVLHDYDFEWK